MTPKSAKEELVNGNKRFVESQKVDRDLLKQVEQTSTGQFPFATILSCIDSRVSSELIFDQGIGDIFSVRIAILTLKISPIPWSKISSDETLESIQLSIVANGN